MYFCSNMARDFWNRLLHTQHSRTAIRHSDVLRLQGQPIKIHSPPFSWTAERLPGTGGWWFLNWGGKAHGNDWSGFNGMLSNISNTWKPAIIISCSPLSSLHCFLGNLSAFQPLHPFVCWNVLVLTSGVITKWHDHTRSHLLWQMLMCDWRMKGKRVLIIFQVWPHWWPF